MAAIRDRVGHMGLKGWGQSNTCLSGIELTENAPVSRNFDSDFMVAVDFRVDRAAKEERHTPALVFVKM
jgi:hypothetical protein